MQKFSGFEITDKRLVPLPTAFFSELLPIIDDLDELKITLFSMWALQQREGPYRYLLLSDFTGRAAHLHGLSEEALRTALARAVDRGTLLVTDLTLNNTPQKLYVANSPSGRTAIEQVRLGEWTPGVQADEVIILPPRPNIFRIYEENIGALTPLIVDDLKDTLNEFGEELLLEAIQYSVQMGKRNLRYVRAVLNGWRKEGKTNATDRSDSGRLLSGELSDFFER